ncbi:hypothetical protein [Methylocapsa acidiphila]|uniref:hypothetical protein n=1 Tax=Methylocapsa acidiphila TaxID=133552 RepID=UPI0003FA4FA4|nr:hypothetical protein [Methylocapsa acidiphila]
MNRVTTLAFAAAAFLSASPAFAHGFGHFSSMGAVNMNTHMNANMNMSKTDSNLVRFNDHSQHDSNHNIVGDRHDHNFNLNRQLIRFQAHLTKLQNQLSHAQMNGDARLASYIQQKINRFEAENQHLLYVLKRFGGVI